MGQGFIVIYLMILGALGVMVRWEFKRLGR